MSTAIPQPPGVPLLGNVFDIDPNNTWGSLKKLADKYGEIFKIKALGTQIVFICSAALLEEICDEKRFRKCVTGPVVEIRHAVHDSLFTAYDNEPSWGIAHRIMAPLVVPSAIQDKVTIIGEITSLLTSRWAKSGSQKFDVTADLRRLNIQTTVKCFFDQDQPSLDGTEPPIIEAMERATGEAVRRPTRPKLLNSLVYQRKFDVDTKTMRDFGADIIKKRQAGPAVEGDMLYALLNGKDPETGKGLTESEAIDEIISIMIGAVTAPNFIAFAVYYLLKNPEEITKARQEIDLVLPPGVKISYEHLPQLPYSEAILRECFRLAAPAPGFNIEPRPAPVTTTPTVQLAGGKYEIPADQTMICVLAAVNRDPAVFKDPTAFRPERMLGDAYDKLPNGVKKGFGNGKRVCFGQDYAWQWCFVVLVTIMRDLDLTLADKSYQLKMDGAFSVKPLNLFAKGSPRGASQAIVNGK